MKFNHLQVPSHWQNYWTRYPEGHTILEALISWVSQVDSMVDNQNKLNTNVEQFRSEIDAFVKSFAERLQDEVILTLQDWQTSGFLEVVISEALQWELDAYKVTINTQLSQMVHVTHVITDNDGEQNLTAELQSLLDDNVGKIIYWDNVGKPYKTRQLNVPSNTHIVFHPTTEVRAIAGYGTNEEVFRFYKADNVVFDGNFATIGMNKPEYTSGEWRHCVSLFGSKNIVLRNLNLNDSGGDGVIVGTSLDLQRPSENVVVEGCIFDNNRRQGISAVGGIYGLTIRNCTFKNTNGTAPELGIDIEPNPNELDNRNIVIENCMFENNLGGAIGVYDNSYDVTIRNVSVLSGSQQIIIKRMNATREHPTVMIEQVKMSQLFIDSVDNVRVRDSHIDYVIAQSAVSQYWNLSLDNVVIDRNNNGGGVVISGCQRPKLNRLTIKNTSTHGIVLENSPEAEITDSHFENCGSATHYPIYLLNSKESTITNNRFRKMDKASPRSIHLQGGGNAGVLIEHNDFKDGAITAEVYSDAENYVLGVNRMLNGVDSLPVLSGLPVATAYWDGRFIYRKTGDVLELHQCIRATATTYTWRKVS